MPDETTTIGAPAPVGEGKPTTDYVVLQQTSGPDAMQKIWVEIGNYSAGGKEAAIRSAIAKHKLDAGVFVAIPARSFAAFNLKVEKTTTVKLEAAS